MLVGDSHAVSNFVFKIWPVSLGISSVTSRVQRHTLYCASSRLRKIRDRYEIYVNIMFVLKRICFDCDVIKQNIQDTF